MLVSKMNLTRNIFLGREVTRMGFLGVLRDREMENRSRGILTELSFSKSVRSIVSNLSGGQQQSVAIGRALLYVPRVVLMDEPTASLSEVAITRFQQLIQDLHQRGCAIIYISHRIPNVLQVANRIIVLKAGEVVGERLSSETTLEEIVGMMVGKKEAVSGEKGSPAN
jgi:ABC-type sugar transport system ATPase subunit